MVDFQSRDTRRGVSDDDDEDADASDEEEPLDDEQAGQDDTEGGDESGPLDAETDAAAVDMETPEDERSSSDAGISATEPSSVDGTGSGDDPLSAETETTDSVPAAGGEEAAPDDPTGAASSGIDRIGDDSDSRAGSEPAVDDPTSPEAEATEPADATTEAADATTEPAASDDPQSTTPSRTVGIALVTVGDSTQGGTPLGETLETAIESTGHEVVVTEHAAGEYDGLQQLVDELVALPAVDVVLTAGGIGITPEERTIEAVHPLLEKALPGFGEAFRQLLFEKIGTGIVAVRSTAGIVDGTLVFSLPADAAAARLAIEEIVATEAPELVAHLDE